MLKKIILIICLFISNNVHAHYIYGIPTTDKAMSWTDVVFVGKLLKLSSNGAYIYVVENIKGAPNLNFIYLCNGDGYNTKFTPEKGIFFLKKHDDCHYAAFGQNSVVHIFSKDDFVNCIPSNFFMDFSKFQYENISLFFNKIKFSPKEKYLEKQNCQKVF